MEFQGIKYKGGAPDVMIFLDCCCCGSGLIGRQWFNRDKGYGLCKYCIEIASRGQTPEEIETNYGVRGVHYDCKG